MLGEKILKLRKQNGFSQEQLGEKVNVTRQTISNWELNETTPNLQQLELLSKALNISADELIGNKMESNIELNNNILEKDNIERENNSSKSNKFAVFMFLLDVLISVMWGTATVICFTERIHIMAIVNLILCITWGIIAVIWHLKKIK